MTQPTPRQFSSIFISYRREDSSGHTGRLYDHLVRRFGKDQVFMDIDQIEPGDDFVKIIEDAVSSCDVLLVVIGRDWLSAADGSARRLDNPNDFVRLEIAAGLQRDILVIPVLVRGAFMPPPSELPDELSSFSRRQASEVSDRRWDNDVKQLIAAIERGRARREEARRSQERETQEQRRHEDEARREEQEQRRRLQERAERLKRLEGDVEREEIKAKEKARATREAEARPSPPPTPKTTPLRSSEPPSRRHKEVSFAISPRKQAPSQDAADSVQKKSGSKLLPVLVGGGVNGVLSSVPVVSILCLIWAVGGGMLAVGIYRRRAKVRVTPEEGMKLGTWAGLFAGLVSIAIGIPAGYFTYAANPELAAGFGGSETSIILLVLAVRTVLLIAFSIIGGLIEAKRKG